MIIIFRKCQVQAERLAGRRTNQPLLQARDISILTNFNISVFRSEVLGRLTVNLTLEIDVNPVTLLRSSLHHLETASLRAQLFYHVDDVNISDVASRHLYFQVFYRIEFKFRQYLKGGGIGQACADFLPQRINQRRADRLQFLPGHRLIK